MSSKSMFILIAMLFYLLRTSSAQECDLPTFEELHDLLEEAVELEIVSNTPDTSASSINATLIDFNITCLAASQRRDLYQTSSFIVRFSFTGTLTRTINNMISSLVAFNTCPAGNNERCVAFLNLECDDRNDMWIVSRFSENIRITTDQPFNFEPRLNCGTCGESGVSSTSPHDPSTNCFPCNETCQGKGSSLCVGLRAIDCCPFFVDDVCVDQCPVNMEPNEEFDCVCQNFWLEPNCTMCGLTCIMGSPNADCSECICDLGITGSDCSMEIDECEGVVCLNNGTCVDMVNNFMCTCAVGFNGQFCGTNIDDCTGVTCSGNGTCIDMVDDFECNCQADFTGELCENVIDNCDPSPCLNDGTCLDGINSFECSCGAIFVGQFCETCILENCAICSAVDMACATCEDGFLKNNDDLCVPPCDVIDCNNGTCAVILGQPICVCPDGFSGFQCEVNIDDCTSDSCMNEGQCIDGIGSFECMCGPNFTGELCETCIIENCAVCSVSTEGLCMICEGNFILSNEGICDDPCNSVNCNNGTCAVISNQTICQCPDGFAGPQCEVNIDDCTSESCANGGTCIDGISSFECMCAPDFTGDNCLTTIDNCGSVVCLNGGTCLDGTESFSCSCTVNFEGELCETCTIENCTVCSQTAGVCTTCMDLFKPGFSQGCVTDFEATCASDPDTNISPNVCRFISELNLYIPVSARCGVDFPDVPTLTGTPEMIFDQNFAYYRELAGVWLARANDQSIDVTGMQDTSGLSGIAAWRAEMSNWKIYMEAWGIYLTDILGLPAIAPCPDVDIDNDDPQELYQILINYWSTINLQFNEQALDTFCPV